MVLVVHIFSVNIYNHCTFCLKKTDKVNGAYKCPVAYAYLAKKDWWMLLLFSIYKCWFNVSIDLFSWGLVHWALFIYSNVLFSKKRELLMLCDCRLWFLCIHFYFSAVGQFLSLSFCVRFWMAFLWVVRFLIKQSQILKCISNGCMCVFLCACIYLFLSQKWTKSDWKLSIDFEIGNFIFFCSRYFLLVAVIRVLFIRRRPSNNGQGSFCFGDVFREKNVRCSGRNNKENIENCKKRLKRMA